MVVPTLLLSGGAYLVAALSFGSVARALLRMPGEGESAQARKAFVAWWAALGLYMLLQGGLTLLAAFGALTPTLFAGSRSVIVPLLCFAVWGLTTYVTFLYTGKLAYGRAAAVFYAACTALFWYVVFTSSHGLRVERWTVEGDIRSPLLPFVYAAVGLPPILGSLAYLTLWPRLASDAQRWRVALVSGSILLWVGSGLGAQISGGDTVKFVTLVLLGLAAAGAVAMAYYPPAWARARLKNGVRDLPVAPTEPESVLQEQMRLRDQRIRDLV